MEMDKNSEKNTNLDILYYKKKFFMDAISQVCTKDSYISETLKRKVEKIQADVDLSLYMSKDERNDIDHRSSNIFGLAPLEIEGLLYNEQKTLHSQLEKYITTTYPKTLQTYDSITDGLIEKLLLKPPLLKEGLTQEQVILIENFDLYHKSMLESMKMNIDFHNLMKEWIDIRMGPVINNAENSVDIFDAENKLLELKAKIANNQLSRTVYGQNNNTVSAYMEIHKDISKSIEKVKGEISIYKNIIDKSNGQDVSHLG